MAHNLKEQEEEINLASNIEYNYVDQHHMQVAKQCQEEDLTTQTQCQKCYKDLQQKVWESAQEIRRNRPLILRWGT